MSIEFQYPHVSFVGMPGETTVVCNSAFYNNILFQQQVGSINIANITFSDCKLQLRAERVSIVRSNFVDAKNRIVDISRSSSVVIEQVTFDNSESSRLSITHSRDVQISHSIFTNLHGDGIVIQLHNITGSVSGCSFRNNSMSGGIIQGSGQNSVHVTKSTFAENRAPRGGILEFRDDIFKVTHSNFTGNVMEWYSNIIVTNNVTGLVSCCLFQNNSEVGYFGGIIQTEGKTLLYITNSTFTQNSANYRLIHLESSGDYVGVISSVFTFNSVILGLSYGMIDLSDGEVTVLASEFSHNTGHSIAMDGNAGYVTVDCTHFYNNTYMEMSSPQINIKNTTFCSENFALGQQGNCSAHDCEGRVKCNRYIIIK